MLEHHVQVLEDDRLCSLQLCSAGSCPRVGSAGLQVLKQHDQALQQRSSSWTQALQQRKQLLSTTPRDALTGCSRYY